MLKHVIYGFFGLLAAVVIALAIYLDKPAPEGAELSLQQVKGEVVDTQVAAVGAAAGRQELFSLVKVIDGDTISIQKGGSSETVRMIGINAPETGQCFTAEAGAKLKELLASGHVALELDPSQGERDKYDRLLAHVFTESGINTAEALIAGGFAKEYTYSKAYTYQADFKNAQASAQEGKKGLWAPGACSAPAPRPNPPAASPQPVAAPPFTPKQTNPPVQEAFPEDDDLSPPAQQPAPQSSSSYTCSSNTYNCSDFKTHAEAQAVFDGCGGVSNDVHKLDANKDGEACESLP